MFRGGIYPDVCMDTTGVAQEVEKILQDNKSPGHDRYPEC